MDTVLLTPYFLDELVDGDAYGLESLANHLIRSDTLPDGSKQARMGVLYEQLAAGVTAALAADRRPVSLAGDCCATIGVLAGLQRAGLEPTLLWFDAHGDYNTWETTPSGFLGGMPLAMAVGRGEQTLLAATGLQPWPEDKVILTDGRDLDPGERELVNGSSLRHLTAIEDLLAPGSIPDGPLYVHFDTDIIDPSEAPAMNYPAPGGPSAAEVRAVFERLATTGRVVAVSVSLWSPNRDGARETRAVTLETLTALLG